MFFKIFCIALVLLSTIFLVSSQHQKDDCVAPGGPIESCSQSIYSNCKNATFPANYSSYGDQCSTVSLFWDAPLYNMTILFQSHFLKPYSLCMKPVGCTKAYRTLDDAREVPIEWDSFKSEPVCFKTERSDRPIMKFRFDAGTQWHCYGTFIDFSYKF